MDEEFSELLRRAQAGDSAAFERLHERHEGVVLKVVRRRLTPVLRRVVDSTDIAQSVWGDVLRDLPRFEDRGEAGFRGWLARIAENKVRDAWRRRRGRDGGRRMSGFGSRDETPPSDAPGPASEAEQNDESSRLDKLIAELPASQRALIELHDWEGLTWAEVAERLGFPSPDAARMQYVRTVRELERKLRE